MSTVKYPEIEAELSGQDGNVFAVIGLVARAIKAQGVDTGTFATRSEAYEAAKAYEAEAMKCDSYDEVLRHAMKTVTVS